MTIQIAFFWTLLLAGVVPEVVQDREGRASLVGEWVPLPSSKTSYLEWPCLCVRSVRPLPNVSALIGPRAERLAASRRWMFNFTSADHCCLVGRESASSGQLDRGIPSVRSRIVNEQRFITFLSRLSPNTPLSFLTLRASMPKIRCSSDCSIILVAVSRTRSQGKSDPRRRMAANAL